MEGEDVTTSSALSTDSTPAGPFEVFFRQEYARVVRIAARTLKDSALADDIAQEVFLSVHPRFQALGEIRSRAWAHAAAVHLSLNALRSQKRRQRREESDAWAQAPLTDPEGPENALFRKAVRQTVQKALSRLPKKAASVLLLRYSGLTYQEVALAMGVRSDQIGTLLSRAEKRLREEMSRETPQ